ncbi:MAG: DUF4147 domain-containing protein [Nitratireductor sp.]|nr:DUF4147 domain-containing protein [Nitratireductor sp.]
MAGEKAGEKTGDEVNTGVRQNETRHAAERIWRAGVAAVGGRQSVRAALSTDNVPTPDLVLAVGKAAVPMALAALAHFGAAIPALAVTKYGHDEASGGEEIAFRRNLRIIEAAHPVPDANSLAGGAALLEAVQATGKSQSLLLLVSGGASALAEVPQEGFDLGTLRAENAKLLASGLDIHAINTRRRTLSRIKGGGLLSHFAGRRADVLAISDVEGDDISVIGSGIGACPAGANFDCRPRIVASNAIAREAASAEAAALDLEVVASEESLHGDVYQVARRLGAAIRDQAAGVAIHGGEPTVVLPDQPGEGGRNQALALALAREIDGMTGVCVLVAGTDGTDGPTDAAGGIVTGESWASLAGGEAALERADAGTWLRQAGALFVTGPTGTNVMDMAVVVKSA